MLAALPTVRGYFLPRIWWVHELSVLDLVVDVLVLVEWKRSREAYVDLNEVNK